MKNLKDLIKPGYIVDIADKDGEEYRYIVVDTYTGISFHNIYEPGHCIDLCDFDNNLINKFESCDYMITGIYQLSYTNGSTDNDSDLIVIWKHDIIEVSMEDIAKKFNTCPENIKIINNGN